MKDGWHSDPYASSAELAGSRRGVARLVAALRQAQDKLRQGNKAQGPVRQIPAGTQAPYALSDPARAVCECRIVSKCRGSARAASLSGPLIHPPSLRTQPRRTLGAHGVLGYPPAYTTRAFHPDRLSSRASGPLTQTDCHPEPKARDLCQSAVCTKAPASTMAQGRGRHANRSAVCTEASAWSMGEAAMRVGRDSSAAPQPRNDKRPVCALTNEATHFNPNFTSSDVPCHMMPS